MRKFKHDNQRGDLGFDIDPVQLAHDLAMLRLTKDPDLTLTTNEGRYYAAYTEAYNDFIIQIDHQCKDDKKTKQEEPANPAD